MSQSLIERRLARLRVAAEGLVYLTSGTFRVFANALPNDVELVDWGRIPACDPQESWIELLLASAAFAPVAEDALPPLLESPLICRLREKKS